MNPPNNPIGFDRREAETAAVPVERRKTPALDTRGYWWPEPSEVAIQFLTRYVFWALGSLFFLTVEPYRAVLLSLDGMLGAYGGYFVLNSVLFWLAMRKLTVGMLRAGMLVDMVMVTVSVVHDPYPVPPSALAYLMVIFGNGMRYGMRPFAESAAAATLGMVLSYGLRYRVGGFEVTPADLFFGLFWVVLVFYAYMLMGRVERQYNLLHHRSRYDALTGLLNRGGFLEAAAHLLGSATTQSPRAVLLADLDAFKSVNDRFGHAAGDRVLTEMGRILRESTGSELVGRWGGDEFVVLLDLDEAAAQTLLHRIEERTALWAQGNGLPVSVSLGVATAPAEGSDIDTLLSVADVKLYQHKAEQRT